MTVLEQLSKLSSADEFFCFLEVPYESAVLDVARLHILRRMGDNLRTASEDTDEASARFYFRNHLERAYQNFVSSSPMQKHISKIHQDAVRPRSGTLVRLSTEQSVQTNQEQLRSFPLARRDQRRAPGPIGTGDRLPTWHDAEG